MPAFSSPDLPSTLISDASPAPRRALWWTCAAIFLSLAIGGNGGRFSALSLIWLSFSIGTALIGTYAPRFGPDSRGLVNNYLLAGCVLFGALWFYSDASKMAPPPLAFVGCLGLAAALAAFLTRLSRTNLGQTLFPAFLALQLVFGLVTVQGARIEEQKPRFPFHVRHDVQWFNQEACRLLLHGQNPYSTKMQNVMGQDMPFYPPNTSDQSGKLPFGYVYMPLGLFFILPGYLMGDFRFAHVFALIGTAWFLAYARPSSTSKLAATLFLLLPQTPFVLILSWTEPVALFFLGATLFCTFRAPKWLPIALGCLICAKQYTVFLLPILPLLVPEKKEWAPLMLKSVAVALFLTLPMALWDVGGFYRSAVQMQFKQPFRVDSLSYLVAVLKVGGPKLSPILGFGALLVGLLGATRLKTKNAASWCSAGSVAYLGFFALNKQAFANYYFWVFGLLVGAVAVALPPLESHEEKR